MNKTALNDSHRLLLATNFLKRSFNILRLGKPVNSSSYTILLIALIASELALRLDLFFSIIFFNSSTAWWLFWAILPIWASVFFISSIAISLDLIESILLFCNWSKDLIAIWLAFKCSCNFPEGISNDWRDNPLRDSLSTLIFSLSASMIEARSDIRIGRLPINIF